MWEGGGEGLGKLVHICDLVYSDTALKTKQNTHRHLLNKIQSKAKQHGVSFNLGLLSNEKTSFHPSRYLVEVPNDEEQT